MPHEVLQNTLNAKAALMAQIMVVDDDADSRDSIASFLELSGHQTTRCCDGKEALVRLAQHRPDVILLDLFMPEMDGPSLLEVIRYHLLMQLLPVVVLTALTESPMIPRVRARRVNSILAKGKAAPEDILTALEEALVRLPG